MAMNKDTKNLLIGGAVGALAAFFGMGLFGDTKAVYAENLRPQMRDPEHERGEYKKHGHKKERHGG
jgi:hypothetical protein